ncbi:MAG TPA: CsbD family protein [Acidimicrobiales bacterium]
MLTADLVVARIFTTKKVRTMGAKSDQVKGHAKEAVGSVIGDKDLESEGKTDRQAGEVKEKVENVTDKVGDVAGKAKDAVEDVVDKAKDVAQGK